MTIREKIILTLMGMAICFGGYSIFGSGLWGNNAANLPVSGVNEEELQGLVRDTTSMISPLAISEAEADMILLAETPWGRDDLFLDLSPYEQGVEGESATEIEAVNFQYSGFVEVGSTRLAVINGLEYSVGDILSQGDYRLRKITPTNVEIEIIDSGVSSSRSDAGIIIVSLIE